MARSATIDRKVKEAQTSPTPLREHVFTVQRDCGLSVSSALGISAYLFKEYKGKVIIGVEKKGRRINCDSKNLYNIVMQEEITQGNKVYFVFGNGEPTEQMINQIQHMLTDDYSFFS